jgi:hypothetical protein
VLALTIPTPCGGGCAPLSAYFQSSKAAKGRVLERLLEPVSASLNEEAARKLIGLKADRNAQARVAALARKCNQGELTARQRDEYELYVMAAEFVAILEAKARLLLARRGQPA